MIFVYFETTGNVISYVGGEEAIAFVNPNSLARFIYFYADLTTENI